MAPQRSSWAHCRASGVVLSLGVAMAALSSMVLSSCGAAPAEATRASPVVRLSALPRAPGWQNEPQPSSVACTTEDSCIVWGTQGTTSPPCAFAPKGSSVGYWSDRKGPWHAISMPDGSCANLTTFGCASSFCLLAGTSSSRDDIWRYDARFHSVRVLPTPRRGTGVGDLSCTTAGVCVMADTVGGRIRFLATSDEGEHWRIDKSLQRVRVSSGASVSALTCWTASRCIVAVSLEPYFTGTTTVSLTSANGVLARRTFAQPAVAGLWCASRLTCSLITSDDEFTGYWLQEHLYVSSNGGRTWAYEKSAFGKSMMLTTDIGGPIQSQADIACTTARCVGIGDEQGSRGTSLMWSQGRREWVGVATRPEWGFDAVSCGAIRCVAVGEGAGDSPWYVAAFVP
jgi:hypothetical protein